MFRSLLSPGRKPRVLGLFVCLLVLCAPGLRARAQAPLPTWTAAYTGPVGSGSANAIAVDAQGSIYITGISALSATDYGIATIKYSAAGSQIWSARYDGGLCSPTAIRVDAQGNVYVAGTVGHLGYLTLKYDAQGNPLWAARYKGPSRSGYGYANALSVDAQGNVYVTGLSDGATDTSDYATLKYDAQGNLLWVARRIGTPFGQDQATALAVDAQGGVYVTGDLGTFKYDAQGNLLWSAAPAYALALDALGDVAVAGNDSIARYDAQGNSLWAAQFEGYYGEGRFTAESLAVDAQGDVYVTGGSPYAFSTLKISAQGDLLWAALTGTQTDRSTSTLSLDGQGNAYVTLLSNTYNSATVAYNAGGDLLWSVRGTGTGSGNEFAGAAAVDAQGAVYVTGTSAPVPSGDGVIGTGFATVKYSPTVTADVTAQMSVTRSGFSRQRPTGHYIQTVTIRNAGSVALAGPLYLALDNLSANAGLYNRTGLITSAPPLNSPYISSASSGSGVLSPGQSVTVTLEFTDPTNIQITYTPRVLVRATP